jgi:hypothetical protein
LGVAAAALAAGFDGDLLVLDPHPAATSPAALRAMAPCRARNVIIVSPLGMIAET